MGPHATRLFRASILARARFIEDLAMEQAGRGVSQYVILGAGLDSFAQRRLEIASSMTVFEVDQAGPLAAAGFEASRPAVVASTGVSLYLTKE